MVDILGDAGRSIADLYDVRGSVIGIRKLEVTELPIVHEMGSTVFSERCSGFIRLATTGAILQSIGFDLLMTGLPAGLYRVLGVVCIVDTAARIRNVAVSLHAGAANGNAREMPIWVWDDTNDLEGLIRIAQGGAASTETMLRPGFTQNPNFGVSAGQPQQVGDQIAVRGQSSAFGAGTVTLNAFVYVGFSQVGGLSSRGLPVPSW